MFSATHFVDFKAARNLKTALTSKRKTPQATLTKEALEKFGELNFIIGFFNVAAFESLLLMPK